MNDPELEELFADPAHREVVDLLKTSRPATPPLDPHFRNYLRAKLMTEARRTLQSRASRPWFPFSLRPKVLAPAMAAVAAGFLVVLVIEVYLQNQPASNLVAIDTSHSINNKTNVATAEPIVIPFTGPVDKNAVAETVVIEPATSVTKQWVGQNLVIIPDHPLAPNTTYTVSLKPTAVPPPAKPNIIQPTPTVAPTPVVMHFTTVRAPVPPVIPPSFKSSNVRYGHDSRLADSGTVFSASWTPAGQLLASRPAGQPGIGSPSTPAATASPSGSPAPNATTDVWLMSAKGTPIRLLIPGGSFPAAAPSGGLFASWRSALGNQATLDIWDLQGNLQSTVATVDGAPDRPAVWLDSDRVAYLDNGTLRIAGIHATIADTKLKVDHGSLAASATGQFLAVESADRSLVIDVRSAAAPQRLPDRATGFAWSSKGDLAFVIQQAFGTDLWVARGGVNPGHVASSPTGQTWSDLNWAPDGASLMLASKPAGAGSSASRLMLINADGSALTPFASQQEYSSPQWSSQGDFVLFTRQDEAGGRAFWTAGTSPSDIDAAEKQALSEVDKFMQARLHGDITAAQDQLDAQGLNAYQGGASSLLSAPGTQFDRYYPVTVQQTASNPKTFLVGVRIFVSRSGAQQSFFEEQLTLVLKDQRYLIDAVKSTPTRPLSHGPTVVSVEVVPSSEGQQGQQGDQGQSEQVRVRFDSDLRANTVTNDTIKVTDSVGKPVGARIAFDPDNHLATLTLKLKPGSTYQLVVTTGVTDINGVALAQEYDAPLVISR